MTEAPLQNLTPDDEEIEQQTHIDRQAEVARSQTNQKRLREAERRARARKVRGMIALGGAGAGVTVSILVVLAGFLIIAALFAITGTTPASAAVCDTPDACATSGDIVQTALKLAWHDSGHDTIPRDTYTSAQTKFGTTGDPTDCGRFVATVLRASGVDPNYPEVGVVVQWPYVQSHPKLYKIISTNLTNTSQLIPGDILYSQNISAGVGHTAIYIGRQSGIATNTLSASLEGHVPEANSDWYGAGASGAGEAGGMIKAARYIGGSH